MTYSDIENASPFLSCQNMHQPHVSNISMSAGQMHWFEEKEIDVRSRTNQWWQFLSPCSIFLGMRFWVLPLRPPPCVHFATVPWFFLVAPPPCIQQPEVWFSNLSLHTHGSGRTSQHWQCRWWCDDLFHKISFQDQWTKGIFPLLCRSWHVLTGWGGTCSLHFLADWVHQIWLSPSRILHQQERSLLSTAGPKLELQLGHLHIKTINSTNFNKQFIV